MAIKDATNASGTKDVSLHLFRLFEKICLKLKKRMNDKRLLRSDFKNRHFARKPPWFIDQAGDAQHCIWQIIYQNLKMPDKISRNSTSFVRHLIYFNRKTGLFPSFSVSIIPIRQVQRYS